MKTALVTGSSGYIGRNLVPVLLEAGIQVFGLDRRGNPPPGLSRFIHADLLDEASTRGALEGVDTVFHLAAAKDDWGLSDAEYRRDNVLATRVLLEEGRGAGIEDWVFFSTVSVLGATPSVKDESAAIAPANVYGKTKAESEELFAEHAAAHPGHRVLAIRPSVVYGPGNPENTNIFRLMDSIQRNRFVMVGDGRVVKTMSYLENLLAATEFLRGQMQSGFHSYIVVDDPQIETRQLVAMIYRALDKRPRSFHLPLPLAAPLAVAADAVAAITHRDLPITSARIRKFCRATHFSPAKILAAGFRQPFTTEQGLEATTRWYFDQHRSSQ